MGKGTLAIRVAEWFRESADYELVKIVPVMPEPVWTDSFTAWAVANGVDHVASGDYRDLFDGSDDDEQLDLVVSVFYDKIIKDWFIDRCTRILNIHNGPLPRYRG